MQLHNANLVGTIAGLKEELASVKESYASINFENEIAAIGQMKEDLQQTRLQISAVESGLASQISAATQQAVEAKQLAEESQKAAASSAQSSADELNDKLEQIRQNVAYLLDAKKGDDEKQADLVEKIEGVAAGGLKKSDLEGLSGQIAELQSGLAAVKKETEGQGKSLQDSVRSFEGKVNKLNANIKMTSNEVSGIREMVTNMVADAEPATEAPSEE